MEDERNRVAFIFNDPDFVMEADFNGIFICFMKKAVNDGLGRITYREYPAVCFRFQWDTSFFKPLNGIRGKKLVKGFFHKIGTPGVFFYHIRYRKTGVCNITSSASADLHFR